MIHPSTTRHKPLSRALSSSSYESPDLLFNFTVQKKIGSAKFRVYLIYNKTDNQQYALKAYPYTENGINERYKRESRFAKFSHPNICRIIHSIPEKLASNSSGFKMYSFLMLEYAPYGDFYELFKKKHAMLSEKLARTYFHQLIEGIDYLHKNNIAHLDIKSENLLIGESFRMKISDFDLSQYLDDKRLESKGTVCYRAPEVMDGTCRDFTKADIYSAGIMLFVLRSGGIPPHLEQEDYQGINLYQLLYTDRRRFWDMQESFQDSVPGNFYSESFRDLFIQMTEKDPLQRDTIQAVQESAWYSGPILTDDQLKTEMKSFYLA